VTQFIDLNCDLGELEGPEGLAVDQQILPLVSSANVACGFHAGSPQRIREIAVLAKEHHVAIGAHPGYADRAGFGRRPMTMPLDELREMVLYQIGVCGAIVQSEGLRLCHVKPHGALYNLAAVDLEVARTIAQAVADWNRETILVGLAGSRLIQAGGELGLRTASEVFADRAYNPDGTLVSRESPNAVLHDGAAIAARLVAMILDQQITSTDGYKIAIQPDTVCIHGDNPSAPEIAARIRAACEASGIQIKSLAR
jgi:5-oxoprolinase (ATP-hydrolysing) subunit A